MGDIPQPCHDGVVVGVSGFRDLRTGRIRVEVRQSLSRAELGHPVLPSNHRQSQPCLTLLHSSGEGFPASPLLHRQWVPSLSQPSCPFPLPQDTAQCLPGCTTSTQFLGSPCRPTWKKKPRTASPLGCPLASASVWYLAFMWTMCI